MRQAGGDVLGVDWRMDLADAWQLLGSDVGVQGNLDPIALFAPPDVIEGKVEAVLAAAAGRPGHIFNLGHGVLPETPPENVAVMVDAVHRLSAR
jgi:uroporphyrinogen decarboxylase